MNGSIAAHLKTLPGGGGPFGKRQYVYVALMANGVVKVGKTMEPKARVSNLYSKKHPAVKFFAVDAPNSFHDLTEKFLIERLEKSATLFHGREYFIGVSFSAACHIAKQAAQRKLTSETDCATYKQRIISVLRNAPKSKSLSASQRAALINQPEEN